MSKKHRHRRLVKWLLWERRRADFFQATLAEEALEEVKARLSALVAERVKISVTPTKEPPCENQTQN
jgi:hypothetical protein